MNDLSELTSKAVNKTMNKYFSEKKNGVNTLQTPEVLYKDEYSIIYRAMNNGMFEGEIVNEIQNARKKQHCVIINAGGYTHTSVAIHDALKILNIPIIELHITNIYKREEIRHTSLISKNVEVVICGFGLKSYELALEALI